MKRTPIAHSLVILFLTLAGRALAAGEDLVIYDNDWNAPGSYIGQAALMPLFASPHVKVIGLTTVTGDCWRDEGAASLLRYLELVGVTDVPVANGAVFPLVNTKERMDLWEKAHGSFYWKGAWNDPDKFPGSHPHDPYLVAPTKNGAPKLTVISENASLFMIRMVHEHPHQVTIYEGGPMTNLALAIGLDPEFAGLAKRLIIEGCALSQMDSSNGFHDDFNIVFDPEAAHITLAAAWAKIISLSEVSNAYIFDKALLARVLEHKSAAGDYLALNSGVVLPLWGELGAVYIADPTIVTKTVEVSLDVDIDHGASYGRTIVGSPDSKKPNGVATVTILQEVDGKRFIDEYVAAAQTVLSTPGKN
jgi:purine nucleosidase